MECVSKSIPSLKIFYLSFLIDSLFHFTLLPNILVIIGLNKEKKPENKLPTPLQIKKSESS